MIGKVPQEDLEAYVLGRTGATDDRVVQGPAYGEDTAAVRVGGEVLVVNTDPISLAVDRVGTLGVTVAANDVAASGARPVWVTVAIFLPTPEAAVLDDITAQLDETARDLGIAIVGGHSEYAPALETPMLVLTCLGLTDRYVSTGGARPGDAIVMTKAAAIEGTAILASDFVDRLDDVAPEVIERARRLYASVSVVAEAAKATPYASAMHDPTEGGLLNGLIELAVASGVVLRVDEDAIPIRAETEALCAAAGVDPMRIFGSGALLATVPEESIEPLQATLRAAGIEHAVIGTVEAGPEPALVLGDQRFTGPIRDDMYALWA
ncbi:MAG: AIR synthase family protein [Halobacteriales archaeon]